VNTLALWLVYLTVGLFALAVVLIPVCLILLIIGWRHQ